MSPVEQRISRVAGQRSHVVGRTHPVVLIAVGAGGAAGATARYGVSQTITVAANGFPWATFGVNVSGSLALGVLMAWVLERFPPTSYVRPFLASGFLGGYTTYSTFAVQTDLLIKNGHALVAATYVVASLAVGCAAAWAGVSIPRVVLRSTTGGRG